VSPLCCVPPPIVEDALEINPARVGLVAKTSAPEPVSSVMREASSEEVSREVEEILLLKILQSDEERRPRGLVALAFGMLSVWVPPAEVKPQPPLEEVVAKVCEAVVRPFKELIAVVEAIQVPETA